MNQPTRREHRAEDRPLLTVHVVHQHRDPGPGEQPGQERHAVLHLEHVVDPAEPAREQEQRRPQVDRQVTAAAQVADAVDLLVAGGAGVERAEDGDLDSRRPCSRFAISAT